MNHKLHCQGNLAKNKPDQTLSARSVVSDPIFWIQHGWFSVLSDLLLRHCDSWVCLEHVWTFTDLCGDTGRFYAFVYLPNRINRRLYGANDRFVTRYTAIEPPPPPPAPPDRVPDAPAPISPLDNEPPAPSSISHSTESERKQETVDDKVIDKSASKRFGIPELRPFQRTAIKSLVAEKDTVVIAPTGQGKSIVYSLLPDVLPEHSIVIVFSPLKSLIRDQVQTLTKAGLKVRHVTEHNIDAATLRGDFSILFAFPEIMEKDAFQNLILSSVYQSRARVIAVDEVDCISWVTFRPSRDIVALGKIRGKLPDARMVTLTATMALWVYNLIIPVLDMTTHTLVRPILKQSNHFFEARPRPKTWEQVCSQILDPIIRELRAKGRSCPRTLIYCNDFELKMHSQAHHYITQQLGGDAWIGSTRTDAHALVTMHPSNQVTEQMKRDIEEDLRNPDGHFRIIIVSAALGRGANFPQIQRLIMLKCPLTLEALLQIAGRTGRPKLRSIGYPVTSQLVRFRLLILCVAGLTVHHRSVESKLPFDILHFLVRRSTISRQSSLCTIAVITALRGVHVVYVRWTRRNPLLRVHHLMMNQERPMRNSDLQLWHTRKKYKRLHLTLRSNHPCFHRCLLPLWLKKSWALNVQL